MTTIEIMTETYPEMSNLIADLAMLVKSGKENENGDIAVQEMSVEANVHDVYPYPMQTGAGLGAASEKGAAGEAEKITGKLIEDLREQATWVDGDGDSHTIAQNMRLAARLLEIELTRREYHGLGDRIKDEQICKMRI